MLRSRSFWVLIAVGVLLLVGAVMTADADAKPKCGKTDRCWLYTPAPRELGWYR